MDDNLPRPPATAERAVLDRIGEYVEERHTTFLKAEMEATHERWADRGERLRTEDWPSLWYDQQCGGCRFWIPLAGRTGLDWGVCAGVQSEHDGTVRFEHDGCAQFTRSDGWATSDSVH